MPKVLAKIKSIIGENMTVVLTEADARRVRSFGTRDIAITIDDSRIISMRQRNTIYALLRDIQDYTGYTAEGIKTLLKSEFAEDHDVDQNFSLANCDLGLANAFLSFLIEFIIENDIPAHIPLNELCVDSRRYTYFCLMHKKCAICGKRAELHHYDVIGMGRNRDTIYQIGMLVLPLCRTCHDMAHTNGKKWVIEEQHLRPIPLSVEIGRVYGLTKKNLMVGGKNELY